MEDKDWEVLVNITWPHNHFAIGWDFAPPTEDLPYSTAMIFLGFITVIFNWE